MARILFVLCTFFVSSQVWAHGGGLNAEGCHNDRRNGGYHCHRGTRSPPPRPRPQSVYAPPLRPSFSNCAAVRAAGRAPLYRGEQGYGEHLDRDGDGIACETGGASSTASTTQAQYPVRPANPAATQAPTVLLTAQTSSTLPIPLEGEAQVLDGDTIQIGFTRVRLFGIDAFEAEQMCETGDGGTYGCGGRATRALQEKISNHAVTCVPKGKDAYDRQLAVCRVVSTDLSSWMARNGHALAYTKYAFDYVSDEAHAKANDAGAWGGTFEMPWDFRLSRSPSAAEAQRQSIAPSTNCVIKGNVNREGKRIYHLPSDEHYNRTKPENWFCSNDEAERAGFRRAGG